MTILWNEVTMWWNEVTKGWNEVAWNEVVMERSDRIPSSNAIGTLGQMASTHLNNSNTRRVNKT